MQSRNAAFAILRNIAQNHVPAAPRTIVQWNKPTFRLFHLSATQPLRSTNNPPKKLFGVPPVTKVQIPKPVLRNQPRVYDPSEAYEMTFTCKPCGTRSSHRVSKQGYHQGSVLISCPECKNRHVISDHLGIFMDKAMTIEDLMRDKGQLVKKGTLGEDSDVEFWEDGTSNAREKRGGGL